MRVFPSLVNYLLIKLERPDWNAARLRSALEPKRILVRDASTFPGLDQRFVRLAVKSRAANLALLAGLTELLT